MSQDDIWTQPNSVIRITRDEVLGSHADDLLRRQKSLRGEDGISRDHGRRWYYQNWFVFMVAGALAAFTAWAVIEPYFDDMLYVQGRIGAVDSSLSPESVALMPPPGQQWQLPAMTALRLRGETIWLLAQTREMLPDGTVRPLDTARLVAGHEAAVYVNMRNPLGLPLTEFVLLSPPRDPPAKGAMPLVQQQARNTAAGLLIFPLVAGLIGLAVGAIDGIICRVARRAILGGLVGLLAGFIGAFVTGILAELIYTPLNALAMQQAGDSVARLSTFGFLVQMTGRTLAWGLAGTAMGLGQGIALRSKRLALYGFLGGIVGGLVGGLLFDPIDLLLLGMDKPSAHWSRMVGFTVIGASVGAMIGLVELLARDAWLRMIRGPLTGKEFLIFKDLMKIGASPRSDIYLFNDPDVAPHHANLRAVGDECEIECSQNEYPVLLNNRPVRRARLRHGDEIVLGRTAFVFQKQRG